MMSVSICLLALFVAVKSSKDPPQVQLNVYFEACCSDCYDFIIGPFKDAFYTPGWTNMTNITALPTGKCNETYDSNTNQYVFSCQHGTPECAGNIWMACAVQRLYSMDPVKYAPFIIDFMQSVYSVINAENTPCPAVNMDNIAKSVCDNLGNQCDWNALSECNGSNEGNQVYHQMVSITPYPNPIDWVPWIILNGQHSDQEQTQCENNVLNCTCKVYQGNSAACS
eukprot:319294_1